MFAVFCLMFASFLASNSWCASVREKRQDFKSYLVDTLVIVDSDMYSWWKKWQKDIKDELNDTKLASATDAFIKEYVSLVFHQANLRLNSLRKYNDYTIKIQLVQIELNVNVLGGTLGVLNIQDSLDTFRIWLKQQNYTYDHAMLMTTKNFTGKDDLEMFSYLGRAYVKGMCSTDGYSSSIIVDKGAFQSSYIIAHELGHNLGADHDGFYSSVSCSQDDFYLMAPVINSSSNSLTDHPWYFSNCSAANINSYVNNITTTTNEKKQNCFQTNLQPIAEFSNTLDVKTGQNYPGDVQCKMMLGMTSRAAPNIVSEDYCKTLSCVDPSNPFQVYEYFAAEWTSCGNGKWCELGMCVYNKDAPVILNCFYGDTVKEVGINQTCSKAVAKSPMICYNETIRSNCCQSCQNASINRTAACQYGDKKPGCEASYCGLYTPDALSDCCGTCSCEIGDSEGLDGMACDARVWKNGIDNCYNDTVAGVCCSACSKLPKGPANCMYGDKNMNCQRSKCSDSTYKSACCETCYGINNSGHSNLVQKKLTFTFVIMLIAILF